MGGKGGCDHLTEKWVQDTIKSYCGQGAFLRVEHISETLAKAGSLGSHWGWSAAGLLQALPSAGTPGSENAPLQRFAVPASQG